MLTIDCYFFALLNKLKLRKPIPATNPKLRQMMGYCDAVQLSIKRFPTVVLCLDVYLVGYCVLYCNLDMMNSITIVLCIEVIGH